MTTEKLTQEVLAALPDAELNVLIARKASRSRGAGEEGR